MTKQARIVFLAFAIVAAILWKWGGVAMGLSVLLLFMGAPLFAVVGGMSEMLWLTHASERMHHLRFLAPEVLSSRFAGSPLITTIPLFTLTGYLMAESRTPERIIRVAKAWVGWLPGGLAIVCVLASAMFTLFTGGSGVTIIAVGGLLYPALRKQGYSESFSLGLVTTGGSVGLLLPFALPLYVFCLVTNLDYQLANKAVLIPGVIVLLLLAGYSMFVGVREKIERTPFDLREALSALWEFKWEMGVPAILIFGVPTGFLQIDEASGMVALYTFLIEAFAYKDIAPRRDMPRIVRTAMSLAGAVILILAMANALVNYVIHERIPERVLDALLGLGLTQPWQFLLILNLFLLVVGMVMDGFSAILVAVPLVMPLAAHFGLGPFHMAMLFVLNLELAFCMPPLGLNIFIASFRFNRPVTSLYRVVLPFAALLAVGLMLVTYVPKLNWALVEKDIAARRAKADARGVPPIDAWRLECVQEDPANPRPCSDADKAKYGTTKKKDEAPAPATSAAVAAKADAGSSADDDFTARISGAAKADAGAPKPAPSATSTAADDDDEFAARIRGKK